MAKDDSRSIEMEGSPWELALVRMQEGSANEWKQLKAPLRYKRQTEKAFSRLPRRLKKNRDSDRSPGPKGCAFVSLADVAS